jgi:hypothetical protein
LDVISRQRFFGINVFSPTSEHQYTPGRYSRSMLIPTRKVRPTFGLGLEIEETNDVGERMERRPAEKNEERLCR